MLFGVQTKVASVQGGKQWQAPDFDRNCNGSGALEGIATFDI
jgi:hypothetical protein